MTARPRLASQDFFYPVIEAYHKVRRSPQSKHADGLLRLACHSLRPHSQHLATQGFSMSEGSSLTGTASERMDPAKIAVDLSEAAQSKIISTRIRVARNLSMFPLNPGACVRRVYVLHMRAWCVWCVCAAHSSCHTKCTHSLLQRPAPFACRDRVRGQVQPNQRAPRLEPRWQQGDTRGHHDADEQGVRWAGRELGAGRRVMGIGATALLRHPSYPL